MKRRNPTQLKKMAERVAVDEIFDDGSVRILRARRLDGVTSDDYSINTWGKEKEDYIDQWRLEAFVGFPSSRKLREGDVFFVVDSKELDAYKKTKKVLPRKIASDAHLLIPYEKSITMARNEIKEEFYKLTVSYVAKNKKDEKRLTKTVERKIKRITKEL